MPQPILTMNDANFMVADVSNNRFEKIHRKTEEPFFAVPHLNKYFPKPHELVMRNDPLEIARQLTIYEYSIFHCIQPKECLGEFCTVHIFCRRSASFL